MRSRISLRAFSPRQLLLSVLAIGALGLFAAPAVAQAQSWDPPNQSADAIADDTVLEYDGESVSCDLSGATAATGPNGEGSITDLWFGPDPPNDCDSTVGDVTSITVDGLAWNAPATDALGGGDGLADIQLGDSSQGVTVQIGLGSLTICTIRVDGPQEIGAHWDAADQTLTVGDRVPILERDNVDVEASGLLCPLASSGTGTYSGTYVRDEQGTDPDIEIR